MRIKGLYLRKGQLPILIVLAATVVGFGTGFVLRKDFEFVIYVGVIVFFLTVIGITNWKVYYPNFVLWCLTLWAILHMAGGTIRIGNTTLYGTILVPLSDNYPVLRYDQVIHAFGFGTATLAMYCVLRTIIRPDLRRWSAVAVITVMAGVGVGALNEMAEFLITCAFPQTGIGGYVNNSIDLIANLVGAILAMGVVRTVPDRFEQK